ncbi:MAG: nuclear transport factor 2 family protein [Anaerolineales bacterium]
MSNDHEVHEFLLRHLQSIYDNDIETYHATTSEDLTLYEWWVTPHRLEGLPFHDFMMTENDRRGTVFGAEEDTDQIGAPSRVRFDLANLHIQRYSNTAIASYTLLTSMGSLEGVKVTDHNESRVLVKIDEEWKVVHVHKSPSWKAPHLAPRP